MNLKFRGNDFIVFFCNMRRSDIDFDSKCNLEKYFRSLFLKIKKLYGIDFSGSYNITVYVDDVCGIIFEIVKDDSEYFDYDDIVDMKISVCNDYFVYKVVDYVFLDDYVLYAYDGELYVSFRGADSIKRSMLFENGDVLYGDCASRVLSDGLIVDNFI